MGIQQGFRGWARIGGANIGGAGGTLVLCRPGAGFSYPRSLDVPHPLQNSVAPQNWADGMRFPSMQLPLIPTYTKGAGDYGWWTAATLKAWFETRVLDDLADLGRIEFADSSDANAPKAATSVKGAGFTLSVSKGDPIGFLGRFAGTSKVAATSAPTTVVAGRPLNFKDVSFGGALAGTKIVGLTLEIDNALTPNPELDDGSTGASAGIGPRELNAGIMSGMLTLQTNGGTFIAGSDGDGDIAEALPTGSITVGGVTFTLRGLLVQDPDSRQGQAGRVIRTFRYQLMGDGNPAHMVMALS